MGFIALNMEFHVFHFIMGFLLSSIHVKVYNILVRIKDSLDNDDFCHIMLNTLALQCGGTNLE